MIVKVKIINNNRQIRSCSSLNAAKDNVLNIRFENTRGYFLISFANTILSSVNIIVNNSELSPDIDPCGQSIWASYIEKKGKRLGFYSQKFVCFISPTYVK
eukprot:155324_1